MGEDRPEAFGLSFAKHWNGDTFMLISEITSSGAMQTLEASVKFAAARQRVIAHNIANLNTPDFRESDLSPQEFQKSLRAAVEQRRNRLTGGKDGSGSAGDVGALNFKGNREFKVAQDGSVTVNPGTPSGNVLFHDRNNRDLERLLQANVENVGAFRVAIDLLRSRYEILRSAIAERV